jgi:hypothetical protein
MIPVILTPEARAALTLNLADARSAYHSLMTGTATRVIVDQNGERVEFQAANRGNLANYIVALEAQLAVTPAASRVLGPARFIF